MERLTCRRNDDGFKTANVLLRGKRFGPAFFPDKADYQDYSDALERLAQYEDTGFYPEEISRVQETLVTTQRLKKEQYDMLGKYLKAEAEGRYVILPVNLGDDVYYLTSAPSLAVGRPTRVEKSICRGFYFDAKGLQICLNWDVQGSHGTYGWWGKTIFATREEAEAALKGENK